MNQLIELIKRLTIISVFANDTLMDRFTLKGGNALDILHQKSPRASMDVDLSMAGDFENEAERDTTARLLENSLKRVFASKGLVPIDYKFEARPKTPSNFLNWGGYYAEFKVVSKELHSQYAAQPDLLRKQAVPMGGGGSSTKVTIDFSKFEHVLGRHALELDGYTIYVYSLPMIFFEKLRALCQQLPEYTHIGNKQRPRPRDCFDIYNIAHHLGQVDANGLPLALTSAEQLASVKAIFEAKDVPIAYLARLESHRDFHRAGWQSVLGTVREKQELPSFDTYYDFTVRMANALLESLGNV